MLVGNSFPEYVLIRIAIIGLRAIAPLSVVYTLHAVIASISAVGNPSKPAGHRSRLPLGLEIYLFVEAAFFLLIYLPLRSWHQYAAVHPKAPEKSQRRQLYHRCLDSVSDPEAYLSGGFLGAAPEEIKRENVKEFLAWSLMNLYIEDVKPTELDELDTYVSDFESKTKYKLVPGRGKARSMRGTFDHVPMQHRPLVWYSIVALVDAFTHARLLSSSLRYYRSSLGHTFMTWPIRPLTWLGRRQTPDTLIPYWYRQHTSKSKLPIVFIHGIGIGLFAYTDFIAQLASHQFDQKDGESVGIIAIELLPISSRIGLPALSTKDTKEYITKILDTHGWDKFVLIGHSYGTAIASTLLREPALSQRIKAAMLMDPICFLLHHPDVCFNFTRRKPRRANERMLDYFSSQDMLISHTLARRFFWSEYILWQEDIANLRLTVILSGKDLIVPTKAVWKYLTQSATDGHTTGKAQELQGATEWRHGAQEVLWFDDFDHAGLFSSKGARRGVAGVAHRLCEQSQEEE